MRAFRAQRLRECPVEDGAELLFRGEITKLRVLPAARDAVRFEDGGWLIEASDPAPESVRALFKKDLIERACRTIDDRLRFYAPIVGRFPNHVTVREQKTRWGSCSSLGNLNFNWKLIMAPPHALDYVVVHELCHLFELNHKKQFWALVERVLPDYRESKKWLKENGRLLGL